MSAAQSSIDSTDSAFWEITMFRKVMVVLSIIFISTYSYATPISITQTFSNVSYYDYGISTGVGYGQSPTDDWTFKGAVDSNAVNISPWMGISAYQLTSLALTQASLGLFDVGITNAPVLLFYPDRFGFALNVNGWAPWAVIVYEFNHFASANTLNENLALITTPQVNDSYTSFGPQWDGFALEDGRRLYGWGFGLGTPAVSAVPEPTSAALMLVAALSMLTVGLRRRKVQ